MEEVAAFLKAKTENDAPLSENELENAAGGTCNTQTMFETIGSIVTAGIVCALVAFASATGGEVGQKGPDSDKGRLCN